MDETNESPMDGFAEGPEREDIVRREAPEVQPARKALVKQWCARVKQDKEHWKKSFTRMREDQDFAFGRQWSGSDADDRYVANIALRHVQQRTAALYAKNPTVVARRKDKIIPQVWDGSQMSLQQAVQAAAMGNPQAAAVLQDATAVVEYDDQVTRFAKTMELLWEYNIAEQQHPFKGMMKLMVRRAITTGVGYVKLGYQRAMERSPELEAQIADMSRQLSEIERITADIADNQIEDPKSSAEAEQLRLMIKDLSEKQEYVIREGLTFDFPDTTAVIPDRACKSLREFLGARWVAQEFLLSTDEIQRIYSIDIANSYTAYKKDGKYGAVEVDSRYSDGEDEQDCDLAMVWEIYDKTSGLVYVVCEGYPDFLREPEAPFCRTERFWPWYPLVMNECDHESEIYPPSDVRLLRHQQKELNRLREGMREHRKANRPKMVVSAGMLSAADMEKLYNHPANAVLELQGLQPTQDVSQLLQPMKMPGLDPNLYESNAIFEDILRAVGAQEANYGMTGGSTATETNIAESARMSAMASNIDDLSELLGQLAKDAGHVMLQQMSADAVKQVVGPGAYWPEGLDLNSIASDVHLEVEAGTTGRPNQAQEIQNAERIVPLLMQVPGIDPQFVANQLLRRLDDKMNVDTALAKNLPSIVAMNSMQQPQAGGGDPASTPEQQGGQGGQNAPQPDQVAGPQGAPAEATAAPPPGIQ